MTEHRVSKLCRAGSAPSALAILTLAGLALPVPAAAQAVCSGPHAGPSKPTAGSIGTESPGSGWAQIAVFHHDTRETFGPEGNLRAFLTDGRAVTSSVYLTGAIGILPGLDAMLQLPVHRLSFDDAAGKREETGFGDPRLYLRISPQLFGVEGIPLALRGGVKLPGSDFPVDAEILPLTEGQRDWELMLESGHSFATLPLYVRGWVGYRWREENRDIRRVPGNERFGYLAVGGPLRRLGWELAIEGLSGLTPTQQGLAVRNSRRELIQIYPSLSAGLGPGQVELGGRFPVDGRNYPGGPAVSVGYSFRWGR
jgi:hypothetical protein